MTAITWKGTPEDFKTWLEGYTARTQPAFETAEGFLLAGPVSLERRPAYWGHDVVRVSGLAGEHTEGPIEYTNPLTGQRETFTGPHDSYRDAGTIMLFAVVMNPDGTIELTPELREPRAAAWFDALLAELRRWAVTPTAPQRPERKGGRPRNADDDWAWEQVNELGRDPREVYPEWLSRIGKRQNRLADPEDSFDKAVKPTRGKKREDSD